MAKTENIFGELGGGGNLQDLYDFTSSTTTGITSGTKTNTVNASANGAVLLEFTLSYSSSGYLKVSRTRGGSSEYLVNTTTRTSYVICFPVKSGDVLTIETNSSSGGQYRVCTV